ncbi:hypothetical protein Cflav_PD0338 [Pedosphaera parvula Ellin514]|uniref:Uncharacterized protein n=1 Tax=Pedosphaera parvula (strain Ellin514) TaxID=320771 RepID=B9XS74_PEDPL|nr:hypothetical protein Cflav_PD0338 [Pedosphaera parvula Ellin514]
MNTRVLSLASDLSWVSDARSMTKLFQQFPYQVTLFLLPESLSKHPPPSLPRSKNEEEPELSPGSHFALNSIAAAQVPHPIFEILSVVQPAHAFVAHSPLETTACEPPPRL